MTLRDNRTDSWPLYVTIPALIALFGGLCIDVLHQISKNNVGAFQTFYPAAMAMRRGYDPYSVHRSYAYIYPPFYAFALQPISFLSPAAAAVVMLAFNAACIVAALILVSRLMLRRLGAQVCVTNTVGVALLAGVLTAVPIYNELRGFETNSILLLSFVLALYWLDRWPILSGLALAVAVNIKYLPIIALPYLLLRRRYAAVLATLFWTIAVALLPATKVGWSTNLKYLQFALGGLLHLAGMHTIAPSASVHATDVDTSISITSALARGATAMGLSPLVGLALTGTVAVAWGVCILLAYARRRPPILKWPGAAGQRVGPFAALLTIEWAGVVTFALAFSPNTQNRNLVLAVVPAALLAALISFRASVRSLLLLTAILVFVCLVLPVGVMGKPFTVFWVSSGCACSCLLLGYACTVWVGLALVDRPPGAETVDNLAAHD